MARKRTAPRIAPPRSVLPQTKPIEECFHYPSCRTCEGIAKANQVLSKRIASGELVLPKGVPDLPGELWLPIFEHLIKDRFGNPTVPALAQMAWLRQLCRATRDAAAEIDTPFDADIEWTDDGAAGGFPTKYAGGVAFGEFKWAPVLAILRCRDNGRMFAVNPHEHMDFKEYGITNNHLYGNEVYYFRVDRFYSLCRLTQLLCCHTAQWNLRLADVHTLAFFEEGEEQSLQGRRLTRMDDVVDARLDLRGEEGEGLPCFVEPEQNLKSTIVSDDGSVIVERYDDYVSFAVNIELVQNPSGLGFFRRYVKKAGLVLVQQDLDYEGGDMAAVTGKAFRYYMDSMKAWYGEDHERFSFQLRGDGDDPTPTCDFQLLIALGYHADSKQVRGPSSGWLVSLFDHHDGKYGFQEWELESKSKAVQKRMQKFKEERLPTYFALDNMKDEVTMQLMAKFAMMAEKSLAATKSTTTRTRRGAAAQACQQMSRLRLPSSAPLGSKTKVTVKIPTDNEGDGDGDPSEGEGESEPDFDDSGSEYEETAQERRDRKEVEAEDEAEADESYASDVSEVGETKKKRKRGKKAKKETTKPRRRAKKVEVSDEEEEEEVVDKKTRDLCKVAAALSRVF